MSVVQLSEISLSYGRQPILESIDLSVDWGEYLVVLGASGCGKTSLLRMIAGLVMPTAGEIRLFGENAQTLAPRNRKVALVPQQAGLYPHLTVRKSISLGIREKLSRPDLAKRIREAASIVELDEMLDRLPQQLSGGQLRRAAVAKAIASRAPIRLLDEPLSAVDASLRFPIESDLRSLHDATPGVTIHVTHDGAEAKRMATRIAVIENGSISQVGTYEEIESAPTTPGVAAVLGSSRFITHAMRRAESNWTSPDGIQVVGPDAKVGTKATLGYFESDQVPMDADGESRNDPVDCDWVDAKAGIVVSEQRLRWFVESDSESP
ncbi:MAG: ABC transporter ATP-binding protein [Planctomycetales bacterium]|nr:ABC transporter ATP-binding protein [Planctomycetales bacterium]